MQRLPHQMELQVFQIPQAAMDQLRIPAARTGGKMPLLHEASFEGRTAMSGSQGEIANDPGSIDSATQDEYVERRFSEALDLLRARVGHSVTSLVYLARDA